MRQVLRRAARLVVAPALVYAGLLTVGASIVLESVFGEGYAGVAGPLRVYLVASAIGVAVSLLHLEVNARRLQWLWVVEGVCLVAITYGLGVFLVGAAGLLGLAWADLVTQVVQVAVLAYGIALSRKGSMPGSVAGKVACGS
jgi:O-antigen/teichoic acid export membrane protein